MRCSPMRYLTDLLKLFSVAALYILLAKLSLIYSGSNIVTVIWPASGLALAALLIGGKRYAWSVFLGAFLINMLSNGSLLTAVFIAVGATVESLLGSWLLNRDSKFDLRLQSLHDYLRLIFWAGGVSSIVAALMGSVTILVSGFLTSETYFNNLIHWWMGDTLGIILITPLILVWWREQNGWLGARQVLEAILVIGITFLVGQVVFLDWFHGSIGYVARGFWMFPLITWAAVRQGTRGVAIILCVTAIQALSGAYHGIGYFANDIAATQLANYWFYMMGLSVVGMGLATFYLGYRNAEAKIQRMTQLYAALSQCSQAIVRCADENELLQIICRNAVEFGGMKMAWIGLIDSDTLMVQPAASFGDGTEYLQSIEISSDADSPFGHGPSGIAIRENQPFWCQDFLADPTTEQWHERGVRFGWRASAAIPIHRSGGVVGIFTLYSGEANAFDEAARNLLVKMAKDISYALNNFDQEAERKQAEFNLHVVSKRLTSLIEAIPDVIFFKDGDGRWLVANETAKRLFKLHGCDWENKTDMEIMAAHPEKCAMCEVYMKDEEVSWNTGALTLFEEHVMDENNQIRTFEVRKVPILDDEGQREGLAIIGRDITESKQTESQLKLVAKVFGQSKEGFVIADANRNIVKVNPAFTAITGYSEAEVIGQDPHMLSSGRHDQNFYRMMWDRINTEGFWQGEIWNRRKNGEVYPELLSISSMTDESGQVTDYVAVIADISAIKESEAQMEYLAHHDPLTDLPNRLLLFYRMEHGIDVAKREGKQLALLMLDLDRFKDVNDSFGHLAGDQLLQQVAKRLASRLREVDTVARLGGDEFTVLLDDIAHPEDAARVAREIINDLSKSWQLPNYGEVRIGVSIGISLYPQHGETPEILLQHADVALYLAKAQGRGRYAYFSDELTDLARTRMELEMRLRRAIARNELRVFYQAQVDIASGRIVGAEALVRWQDATEGLILPVSFTPLAEETGLIIAIGEWVLRETCRQGREWLDAGLPSLTLAVNVSAHQYNQSDISGLVAAVLAETSFPADNLELELTETGLLTRKEEAVQILNSLRAQGVRLAIDDFGTGYSSLARLKRFPLDALKIDKSFINDIPSQQDAMEIAATIISLGHALGFKVLAEGVETEEQLAFLKAQGCDLYQGYLKSHPLPAEDFVALLRSSGLD